MFQRNMFHCGVLLECLTKDLGSSIGAVLKATGMQGIDVFDGLKQGNRQI